MKYCSILVYLSLFAYIMMSCISFFTIVLGTYVT